MTSSRSLLISVALGSAILGVTVPFSWHYFSVQAYKEKLVAQEAFNQRERAAKAKEQKEKDDEKSEHFWKNVASEIRAVEKRVRAGEKLSDISLYPSLKGTSPLQVIKCKHSAFEDLDDDRVLDIYRSWLYQKIPKDQFRIWGREPFGQEKIDAAQEGTGDAAR